MNQRLTSELEVLVNISHPESGVSLHHYRTIDLQFGSASAIVDTLLGHLDQDGIDYRKKLFCSMTDGCNAMQGENGGVKKLLAEKILQFVDLGSCNDHHISKVGCFILQLPSL